MKLTLESLYKDHDNLRRVLYLLEQLLVDIYRGTSRNYQMLQRTLKYIQDYPERAHHPTEDAMFSVILKKGTTNKKFRENLNKIMKDHSEIEVITRDVIEAVERFLMSAHPDFSDIGGKLSTLISRQRFHLLFEEMEVYPHIAEHLDSEDWKRIATLIPDHEDPIFGDKVKKEYEVIFKSL